MIYQDIQNNSLTILSRFLHVTKLNQKAIERS